MSLYLLRTQKEAISLYVSFLNDLGCKDMLCLRKKSPADILKSQNSVLSVKASFNVLTLGEQWGPVVDSIVILDQLLYVNTWLSQKSFGFSIGKRFTPKPIIVGTTSGEGIGFVFDEIQSPLSLAEFKKSILSKWINLLPQSFYDQKFSRDLRHPLSSFVTDFLFTCGVRYFLKGYHEYQTNIYAYVFNNPLEFKYRFDEPYCTGFACHVDDMPFVFGNPKKLFSNREKLLSLEMMSYWTNFAKRSTPASEKGFLFDGNKYVNQDWPEFDPSTSLKITFTNTTNIVEKYETSCRLINTAYALDLFHYFG